MLEFYALLRPNEILNMKIKDIDIEKQVIAVAPEIAKNGKFRLSTIPDILVDYLKRLNLVEYKPDMYVFQSDGMAGDETAYNDEALSGALVSAYAPIFGSMMTGSGFNCAAAALMLKKQTRYSCPVPDNPHSVNICTKTEESCI